jgi:enoyl-CoA hydratase
MEVVTYESEGNVAVITIRRPEKLNAINKAVAAGLREAFQRLEQGDDRVGVITGEGPRAFSSGADIVDSPAFYDCLPGISFPLDKPLISAVNGYCVGGALIYVLMSDLCVATEDAKFMYPEARLGLTGGLIAGLAARIPHKLAMEIMMLGEPVGARRAYEMGLVNRVVPVGQHLAQAKLLGARLAGSAPMVLTALKQFVENHILPRTPAEITARTRMIVDMMDKSHDAKEGEKAFYEKRNPRFLGR